MEKLLLTRKDAANVLSISVNTLDRLSRNGTINKAEIGSRVYFRPDDLVSFVSSVGKDGNKC